MMNHCVSPTQKVLSAIGDGAQLASHVVGSWHGDSRPLDQVLADLRFDELAAAVAVSPQAVPAQPQDPEWIAAHSAYEHLKDTPAAFLVQYAAALAEKDAWTVRALTNNPTSIVRLWRSLVWAGEAAVVEAATV